MAADSVLGADPLGDSYGYVGGMVENATDPSGHAQCVECVDSGPERPPAATTGNGEGGGGGGVIPFVPPQFLGDVACGLLGLVCKALQAERAALQKAADLTTPPAADLDLGGNGRDPLLRGGGAPAPAEGRDPLLRGGGAPLPTPTTPTGGGNGGGGGPGGGGQAGPTPVTQPTAEPEEDVAEPQPASDGVNCGGGYSLAYLASLVCSMRRSVLDEDAPPVQGSVEYPGRTSRHNASPR